MFKSEAHMTYHKVMLRGICYPTLHLVAEALCSIKDSIKADMNTYEQRALSPYFFLSNLYLQNETNNPISISSNIATATLRRPEINQYTASIEGEGLQNQQNHHIILTKYEALHPTAVSENYSSSGMPTNLIKVLIVSILRYPMYKWAIFYAW